MLKEEIVISWLHQEYISREKLFTVKIKDNQEPLVDLIKFDPELAVCPHAENIPFTGNTILVRRSVAQKLKKINKKLQLQGLRLKITDGYRPMQVQKKMWQEAMAFNKKQNPTLSLAQLTALTDDFIGFPKTACHPTGGAVDVTLVKVKNGKELWMGTKIDETTTRAYAKYPFLSKRAIINREMLSREMLNAGFYQMPTEWWHFSYGTIDWAYHNRQRQACYGQLNKF